jgi:hypothetical protein
MPLRRIVIGNATDQGTGNKTNAGRTTLMNLSCSYQAAARVITTTRTTHASPVRHACLLPRLTAVSTSAYLEVAMPDALRAILMVIVITSALGASGAIPANRR